MGNRSFTISFVVACLAVMMVYSYVTSTEETLKKNFGEEEAVVVAKKDIKELDILDETNLTTITIPHNFVQPGTRKKKEDIFGGLAIAPILKDEQITMSKVTQLGARTGLARQVSMGKRAVSIPINDTSGVGKLIKPGDRVDIMANIQLVPGKLESTQMRTILQDVLILATGKYVTNTVPGILERDQFRPEQKTKVALSEYSNFSNITVEVDPTQSQALMFAVANFSGGIYLTLRNNDDNGKDNDLRVTKLEDMTRGGDSGKAPASVPIKR